MTLLGFAGISLCIVLGTLYGILSRSITQEFINEQKAHQAEVSMAIQDRFNLLETRIKEASLNNAIRVNLMLGVRNQTAELVERLHPVLEGAYFIIQERQDSAYIPQLSQNHFPLKLHLEKLRQAEHFQSIKFHNYSSGFNVSLFSAPIKRKDERLGTIYAIYELCRDTQFWERFEKSWPGRLLILDKDDLVDLRSAQRMQLSSEVKDLFYKGIVTPNFDLLPNKSVVSLKEFPKLFYAASSIPLDDNKKGLLFKISGLCATIFCLALLMSFLIGRRISEPLETMADQALDISKEPSASFLDAGAIKYAEFQKLAKAFNLVLQNLTQARLKVQKANKFLNAVLNTVADPVFVKDDHHRFLVVNDACCDFYGLSKDAILGKTAYDLFPKEEADAFHQRDHVVLAYGKENISEGKITDASGEIHLVSTKKRIFENPETGMKVLVGVLRDITHAKRIEKELSKHRDNLSELVQERTSDLMKANEMLHKEIKERERAEKERQKIETQLQRAQKMEAIGALAGGVAHDLNNILSGIVSYPELLLMNIAEDSSLRDPLLTILESGKKAAAIVQDLLNLARRGVAVTEVVDFNLIVSDYLKSPEFNKLASYHPGVQVEASYDPSPLSVLGSPVHLSKTVMNLVSNAAEAMPDGGRLSIKLENRYIDKPIHGYDNVKTGDYVLLTVSDTGTGISAGDIERIFEPFYTKKKMGRSGTGLGMAVVWGSVKDHQGYIDVQSTEGVGTTFKLYFPVTRQKRASDESKVSIADYSGNGETILIVDDMKEQREIAFRMLQTLGYSVKAVSSGEEAVNYLQEHSADLVVLDMIMNPGIDGLDTYKKILEIHPKQKAIVASGFSETDRIRQAQKLGVGAYVRKPYTLEEIGLAVKSELDR